MVRQVMQYLVSLFFCIGIATSLHAQRNTTPGYPWTYVTPDSLPAGAIDTAFENSFFDSIPRDESDIRWVYRVRCHMDQVVVTDSNTIFAMLPRNPNTFGLSESVDTIEYGGIFRDTFFGQSFNSIAFASNRILGYPNFNLPATLYEEAIYRDDNGELTDTVHFASIARSPGLNFIITNRADSVYRSYCYFLQYIDSIWHPRISSLATPPRARAASVYPNPATGPVTVAMPSDVSFSPGGYILRIYGPDSRLLDTRRIYSAHELRAISLPAAGGTGLFTLTLYDERGQLTVGRVMRAGH